MLRSAGFFLLVLWAPVRAADVDAKRLKRDAEGRQVLASMRQSNPLKGFPLDLHVGSVPTMKMTTFEPGPTAVSGKMTVVYGNLGKAIPPAFSKSTARRGGNSAPIMTWLRICRRCCLTCP
jgi:hypothetical protein